MIPRENEDDTNKINPNQSNDSKLKADETDPKKTEKMKEENYNNIYSVKPNNLYL
jgi:hypothetical protein